MIKFSLISSDVMTVDSSLTTEKHIFCVFIEKSDFFIIFEVIFTQKSIQA